MDWEAVSQIKKSVIILERLRIRRVVSKVKEVINLQKRQHQQKTYSHLKSMTRFQPQRRQLRTEHRRGKIKGAFVMIHGKAMLISRKRTQRHAAPFSKYGKDI